MEPSRVVRVRPRTRETSSASSSKVSKKSPMRNSRTIPGCRALASRYCCIIGVIGGLFRAVAELVHHDRPPVVLERDLGHVVADEQQPAAAGPLQVLRGG